MRGKSRRVCRTVRCWSASGEGDEANGYDRTCAVTGRMVSELAAHSAAAARLRCYQGPREVSCARTRSGSLKSALGATFPAAVGVRLLLARAGRDD